jgi:hypothetical protein
MMDLWWVALDFVAVGFSVFLLRAAYRRAKEPGILSRRFPLEGDEGDAMAHLIVIDLLRRNRNRIPRETPTFTLASGLDYPVFYHKILSYISRRWLDRGEWLINPAFEGAHAALVYLAAWWVFAEHLGSPDPRAAALLTAAAWAVTPVLVFNPRRGSMIGERCFGYLFSHVFLFAAAMLIVTGDMWWLALAAPAFAFTMASSKFSLQAMVFVGGMMAVLAASLWPVLALGVGIAFAIAATLGYVVRVFIGSVNHSWVYWTFTSRVHAYTIGFSHRDLVDAVRALVTGRFKDARASWLKHPLRWVATLNPWIAAPVLMAVHVASSPAGPIGDALMAWSWAAIIVAIATMTDWLKFLGEGERYIEVGLFPMIVLCVAIDSPVRSFLLFAGIAYGLWHLLGVYTAPGAVSTGSPEMQDLVKWLGERSDMVLFPVPGRISLPIAYETQHRFVWAPLNVPRGDKLPAWKALFSNGTVYPFAAPEHIAGANARYGADAFVVDRRACAQAETSWSIRYDFSGLPVLYENARYSVIGAGPAEAAWISQVAE